MHISEHRFGNAVIIEGIAGRVLEVPLDLAGVSVESNSAVSVEVVALADKHCPSQASVSICDLTNVR